MRRWNISDQVFLFCIGAQKAGTSWLWRYLQTHPDVNLGPYKELHYFDANTKLAHRSRQRELDRRLSKHLQTSNVIADPQRAMQKQHDLALYQSLYSGSLDIDRYRNVVIGPNAQANLVGDFTPAYALLSPERYKLMASVHNNVRFLFLLRDPVERLWSQLRMTARRRKLFDVETSQEVITYQANKIIAKDGAAYWGRSDYVSTLEALKQGGVLKQTRIWFFEEMFGPQKKSVRQAFFEDLGLDFSLAKPRRTKDKGPSPILPDAVEQELFRRLQSQYENLPDMIGRDLPAPWVKRYARLVSF